jgi:hypothetical protein
VNIYTDSKHAFATLHIHAAIYKERGLLTAGEKRLKTKKKSSNFRKQPRNQLMWLLSTAETTKGAHVRKGTSWLTRRQGGQQKS